MISHLAMGSLRCAAAVVCCVPTVRLRIEVGDGQRLDVRRPPFDPDGDDTVVPPCVFRREVAQAYADYLNGVRQNFLRLKGDPRICYGLAPGDRMFPGGVLRVGLGSRWLHAVPLTEHGEAVRSGIGHPVAVDDWCAEVGAFEVTDLGVTLLHVVTPLGDCIRSRVAVQALQTVVGRVTVAALEMFLAPGDFGPFDSTP